MIFTAFRYSTSWSLRNLLPSHLLQNPCLSQPKYTFSISNCLQAQSSQHLHFVTSSQSENTRNAITLVAGNKQGPYVPDPDSEPNQATGSCWFYELHIWGVFLPWNFICLCDCRDSSDPTYAGGTPCRAVAATYWASRVALVAVSVVQRCV